MKWTSSRVADGYSWRNNLFEMNDKIYLLWAYSEPYDVKKRQVILLEFSKGLLSINRIEWRRVVELSKKVERVGKTSSDSGDSVIIELNKEKLEINLQTCSIKIVGNRVEKGLDKITLRQFMRCYVGKLKVIDHVDVPAKMISGRNYIRKEKYIVFNGELTMSNLGTDVICSEALDKKIITIEMVHDRSSLTRPCLVVTLEDS